MQSKVAVPPLCAELLKNVLLWLLLGVFLFSVLPVAGSTAAPAVEPTKTATPNAASGKAPDDAGASSAAPGETPGGTNATKAAQSSPGTTATLDYSVKHGAVPPEHPKSLRYDDLDEYFWNAGDLIAADYRGAERLERYLYKRIMEGNALAMSMAALLQDFDKIIPSLYFRKAYPSSPMHKRGFWLGWAQRFTNPGWPYLMQYYWVGNKEALARAIALGNPTAIIRSMEAGAVELKQLAPDGSFALVGFYGRSQFRRQQMAKALDMGCREAQDSLARYYAGSYMHNIGWNVEPNEEKALYYAHLSAEQGCADAHLLLHAYYVEGIMVTSDAVAPPPDPVKQVMHNFIATALLQWQPWTAYDAGLVLSWLRNELLTLGYSEEDIVQGRREADAWLQHFWLEREKRMIPERLRRARLMMELAAELGPELAKELREGTWPDN